MLKLWLRRSFTALMLSATPAFANSPECAPRDFLLEPLDALEGSPDPIVRSLLLAYPAIGYDSDQNSLHFSDGTRLSLGEFSMNLSDADLLMRPTITDQFFYKYPLAFELESRSQPYFDPGRIRNDAFFRTLYFSSAAAGYRTLVSVEHDNRRKFRVTTLNCVAVQLNAAMKDLEGEPALEQFFTDVGGSFNWRTIAGTDRLSVHSFGAAIDVNAQLGRYWRWDGFEPGAVGNYPNEIPQRLVVAMERRGFIWGGKWHHYDGMHFEYRPELILYSRLTHNPG